ncbi:MULTISPECIES: 30S ribosomal protein S20 [Holospora]|uniref:Small ribosomal subunit protein bS20 n=2 Tax=Holospora TaxID=44747 RepID=A0A061JGI2_9PROT|nr:MULTISPECIES: 30S ribosomal protein S20 [Holospora]ETZ05191.1 30S ribosomal protein S20 [Holospora undulata HU1]GAJ46663.1 30S ribosomal protein S20 [Holospora elegans E1]
MPYHISPKKRLRRDARVRQQNHSKLHCLRTFLKKTRQILSCPAEQVDLAEAKNEVRITQSIVAKSAAKNIIHRRSASRRISRLMKKLNAIAS